MSAKKKSAIIAAAASVAFATMTMVEPHLPNQPVKTAEQIQQEQRNQSQNDLSDAVENQKNQNRDSGDDLADAESRDRLRPGEHRPPELPKFRFFPK